MDARGTTTSNRNRLPQSSLLLLALQIAVPVGVVDLVGGGVPLSALSIEKGAEVEIPDFRAG